MLGMRRTRLPSMASVRSLSVSNSLCSVLTNHRPDPLILHHSILPIEPGDTQPQYESTGQTRIEREFTKYSQRIHNEIMSSSSPSMLSRRSSSVAVECLALVSSVLPTGPGDLKNFHSCTHGHRLLDQDNHVTGRMYTSTITPQGV